MKGRCIAPVRALGSMLAAVLGTAGSLSAQAVRGQLVDRGNGLPISGAFVVLLDSAGREVARTLTGESGTFLLPAPGPGSYRLQSKRIGFRLTESPPLALAEGQIVGYRLEVAAVPAQLPPVVVEGRPQCGSRSEVGSAVAELWEEVHEALAAVRWTEGQTSLRYSVERFERELPASGLQVTSERRSAWSGFAQTPFRSVPAVRLAATGYVVPGNRDTVDYYAPDAQVLLDDSFAATHCFSARPPDPRHPGMVGIAFEPVPHRSLPEVAGVLWLEQRTLRLRSLEFTYVHLPGELPEGPLGGQVDFLALPSGQWIVKHWWIRTARMGRVVYQNSARPAASKLLGYREIGGQVLSIATAAGRVIYSAELAVVDGTVVDSSRSGRPLVGAVIALSGTGRQATTDEAGRFSLAAALQGTYGLAAQHPRLDSLGISLPAVPVQLVRGERTTVTLAVPPESVVVRQLCPAGLLEGERVVVGVVRATPAGPPVPQATVEAGWEGVRAGGAGLQTERGIVQTAADSAGRFTLCGVPPARVRLLARGQAGAGPAVALEFTARGVWIEGQQYRSLPGRIWKQDLALAR